MKEQSERFRKFRFPAGMIFVILLCILLFPASHANAASFSVLGPTDGAVYSFGEEIEIRVNTSIYTFAYMYGQQIGGPNHVLVEILKDGKREEFIDFRYGYGDYPKLGTVMTYGFVPKKIGKYTLRACRKGVLGDMSKIDTADITLTFQVTKTPVSEVRILGSTHSLAPGSTYRLQAEVLPENAYNKDVKWSSSNKKVATVDQNGVVKTSAKAGGKTVTITATSKDGTKKKGTWKITVMNSAVKKITISGGKKLVYPGETMKLTAVLSPSKGVSKEIMWTGSNSSYAAVEQDGTVIPYTDGAGKKVTVTAKATDGSGVKKSFSFTIGDALQAFTADLNSKGKLTVFSCGKTDWLKKTLPICTGDKLAFLQGSSPSVSKVTFTSSDPKILAIKNGIGTAKKAGKVKVKITVTKSNKKKVSAALKFKVEAKSRFPYVDECGCTRYGLIVNGKAVNTKHPPFHAPDGSGDTWIYFPVEDTLKALGVSYVKTSEGIGGTLNGKVYKIIDGKPGMTINDEGHFYGNADGVPDSTPNIYEGVLFAPGNFFDCFAEGARVRGDGVNYTLELNVDLSRSGANGVTKEELKK